MTLYNPILLRIIPQDRVSNQEEKINAQLRRIEELETAAASERGTFSQELEGALHAWFI